MSEYKIIKLQPDDWQRYREIRLECLREEPQAFGSSYADMVQKPAEFWQGRLADAAQAEKSWLLFAQEGEQLIGIIGAFYEEESQAAHIISVYVRKSSRGRGLGKALMEGILSEVKKKQGIHTATLGVNQEQAAAVALYRGFGFQVTEELEEIQGDGRMHPGFLMQKELD